MSKFYYALIAWFVVLIGLFYKQSTQQTPPTFIQTTTTAQATTPQLIKSDVSRTHLSVHSATLAHIRTHQDTMLMSAWFAGSREGAKDVQIYASFLPLADLQTMPKTPHHLWSEPMVILTPEELAQKSGTRIKKLGNPVLHQTNDGTIHLFVVATSYAGWAASKIYHLTSKDGKSFDFKQILPLSPFLNISHLVRVLPISLSDGGFYLPIYHEMAAKFEVILRFDEAGNLMGKMRPNGLTKTLQPSLAPISSTDCLMARRHRHSQPLLIQECTDGGQKWSTPTPTNVDNDNSSLNVIAINGTPYLIHNQRQADNTRFYLYLSQLHKQDGRINTTKTLLLDTADTGEVSYPTSLMVGEHLHIVYTHDRKSIRHIALNQAFIDEMVACQKMGKTPQYDDESTDAHVIHHSVKTPLICR